MKGSLKHKAIAMILTAMIAASPVCGTVYAADELPGEQITTEATVEVKKEAPAEAEAAKLAEETKEAAAVEEKKEEPAAEEAKAEAPAAEEEKAEAPAEEQAAEEEEDAPVVVLDQPASEKLTVHISNILWTVKKSENGKAVPFETTVVLSNNQTKLQSGFNSFVGGKTITATTRDGKYKFLQAFVLTKAGSGIVTASSASDVKAISKIGFKNGTATVTFVDGSTKQIVNASDIYISPVYSVEYAKHLTFRYIDGVSTGSGSWADKDGFTSLTHTFKQPEAQAHYRFIKWEDEATGIEYQAGSKYTVKAAELPAVNNEVNIYAWWQPSVTVRYHYNGQTAETESFEGISVYEKSAEIDGIDYNGWYDAEGNLLDESAVYEAPAPVKERAERTVYDVYAKRPVTIEAASGTWKYDGRSHSDSGVEVIEGGLFEGDEIVAEVKGEITSVGETANVIESVKIMRGGRDVTEYYDITTVDGELSIEAVPAAPAAGKTDNRRPAAPAADNAAPAAEIGNGAVPKAAPEAVIADSEAPLAANSAWALINLILAIITGIASAVLLAGYFGKKEDEEEAEENGAETERKGSARLASLIPAIGATVAFILTENMNDPMVLTDRWTVLMAVILMIQALVALMAKKEVREEEPAEETINA